MSEYKREKGEYRECQRLAKRTQAPVREGVRKVKVAEDLASSQDLLVLEFGLLLLWQGAIINYGGE